MGSVLAIETSKTLLSSPLVGLKVPLQMPPDDGWQGEAKGD